MFDSIHPPWPMRQAFWYISALAAVDRRDEARALFCLSRGWDEAL